MKRVYLVESKMVRNWFVDLWSNGVFEVFNTGPKAFGGHRLGFNAPLDDGFCPKDVARVIRRMRSNYAELVNSQER